MIVTLDGPAGAGKSTVARALARRLGFRFLDTGAMYRAVAWAAFDRGHDWSLEERLVEIARQVRIDFAGDCVLVDDCDVTTAIRTPEITNLTHYAANNPGVRAILVDQQRQLAGLDDFVTEGRDQGTIVFPHAECKIFLTASPEERARRRQLELQAKGETVDYAELLADQNLRDSRDRNREVGPLARAADAVNVPTDGLDMEQVIDRLETIVRERMAKLKSCAK
jgi:cytidylate kinase